MDFEADELWQPTVPTEWPERDYERECARRAIVLEACAGDAGLQRWELERCAADPWYWMTSYLWVLRPDLVDVVGVAELPFLGWPAHKRLAAKVLGLEGYRTLTGRLRHLMVKKSRDVGVSVLVLGCLTHGFVFGRNETSYVISLRREAVDTGKPDSFNANLFGKVRFFLEHLPEWQRPSAWVFERPKAGSRRRSSAKPRLWDSVCSLVNPDNGCSILGSSTTPNATRSARARHVMIDEADSIPFLHTLLAAALKVGPIRMVSSVTDSDTPFAQVWQGETGLAFDPQPTANGWLQDVVMYSDRPDWNPLTERGTMAIAEMRDSIPVDIWQTEMECRFRRVTAGSIWGAYISDAAFLSPDAERAWMRTARRRGELHLVEGWDYGESDALTAWVLAGYLAEEDLLIVLDYCLWDDSATMEKIISDLDERGCGPQSRPEMSWGDGSGGAKAARTMAGEEVELARTWLSNMRNAGIHTRGLIIRNARRMREYVRSRFQDGSLLFASAAQMRLPGHEKWPSVADACRRYRMDASTGGPEENKKAKFHVRKDVASHPAEALCYIVWGLDHDAFFRDVTPRHVQEARKKLGRA